MSRDPLRCVVSVSGIRGVIGSTLDVSEILGLSAAFGTTIAKGGTVVLGRDSRPTGAWLAQAVAAGLRGVGCSVVDIGMVPTPTVQIMVGELKAAGGIQISASHNPVEWNALKLFSAGARTIGQDDLDKVLTAYREQTAWKSWSSVGAWQKNDQAVEVHLRRVLASVSVDLIKARKFRVLIDSVNGAGSVAGPELLKRLGCTVVSRFTDPQQVFPRDPEPTAANLVETCAAVAKEKVDIGFVQDPDADRLAIIDERGGYIGEEYTLVLCAASRIAAQADKVPQWNRKSIVACTNLSTSRMLEDVAAQYGATVVRSKVGEANVVDAMQKHEAVVGGEGNGGVIDPRVVWGRDSHIGMALVLEYLARAKASVSGAVAALPRYAIHKEKIAFDRAAVTAAIEKLRTHPVVDGADLDRQDGIKLIWKDRWVHVRASGTEPVSRIIAEAPTMHDAVSLAQDVRSAIGAPLVTGH